MSPATVHPPGPRGLVVVGVTTVADRVGVVARPDAAQPWRPGMRLPAPPVIVARHGDDVARWVQEAVLAVRLACITATTPQGTPPVAVPRPLPGGYFVWHPMITGALLVPGGPRVVLVEARWVERAGRQLWRCRHQHASAGQARACAEQETAGARGERAWPAAPRAAPGRRPDPAAGRPAAGVLPGVAVADREPAGAGDPPRRARPAGAGPGHGPDADGVAAGRPAGPAAPAAGRQGRPARPVPKEPGR